MGGVDERLLAFLRWWMNVGDKPVVSFVGRDGGGAYSSPGVIDGVGVSAAARLAVRQGGTTKWLEAFDHCEALIAPGTATWRCTDATLGAVNLTTFPLQENQTGLVLRASVARGGSSIVWATTLTGKNDTLVRFYPKTGGFHTKSDDFILTQ